MRKVKQKYGSHFDCTELLYKTLFSLQMQNWGLVPFCLKECG